MEKIESLPIFFIIGRPRTGTTLIRTLFDAHPNVNIPPECPIILNLFPKYGGIINWDQKNLIAFYKDVQKQRKFISWQIDLEKLKIELLECEGETTFQHLIKLLYGNNNSLFDKDDIVTLGDKNPVYSIYIKKIFKAFPDAKYIHLTRDYRDNILSILKVDFEAPIVPLIAYRWRYSAINILRIKKKYPAQFFTIKYEDFVNKSRDHYKKLCEFVGVPFDDNVFDFYKKKDEIYKLYPSKILDKYHKSLFQPISNKKVGLWKKEMKEKDIKAAEAVIGKYAEMLGYERKYKRPSLWTTIRILPGITYGRLSYVFGFFVNLLPFRLRMAIINRGSILAGMYWKVYSLFKK